MKLVSVEQMRELERAAVAAGATWPGLMEQAGWGVAQIALGRLREPGRRALVLVGPGNNGGDGLVVARHLHDAGLHVQLYLWRRAGPDGDANWQRCRQRGISELAADSDPGLAGLRAALAAADLVVDGLLGAGASRTVEGELAAIVAAVNEMRRHGDTGTRGYGGTGTGASLMQLSPPPPLSASPPPLLLAIDTPTGVAADSGAVLGAAIRADLTVATGALKRGLLLPPGRGHAGELALADIGIPAHLLEAIMSETLTADYARRLLPARPADAHKGTFGKVMVVAGSLNYPGAALLACGGAQRVGAGLVTLGAGRTVLGIGGRAPEVTLLPLPEGEWGAVGPGAVEELAKELGGYAALVLGPGLGRADATREFIQRLLGLEQPKARARVGFIAGGAAAAAPDGKPVELPPGVIDADGLNLLAAVEEWPERLPKGRFVFTPHPGEMRRLLGAEELPGDAPAAAAEAAARWGQVVVLKGATTVVASPEGKTLVHDGGNPALATAGTGDVLAGAIGGLLAQGLAPFDAAALAVYLHGRAGARVRDELGEMGVVASDLLPELPRAIKALRG